MDVDDKDDDLKSEGSNSSEYEDADSVYSEEKKIKKNKSIKKLQTTKKRKCEEQNDSSAT